MRREDPNLQQRPESLDLNGTRLPERPQYFTSISGGFPRLTDEILDSFSLCRLHDFFGEKGARQQAFNVQGVYSPHPSGSLESLAVDLCTACSAHFFAGAIEKIVQRIEQKSQLPDGKPPGLHESIRAKMSEIEPEIGIRVFDTLKQANISLADSLSWDELVRGVMATFNNNWRTQLEQHQLTMLLMLRELEHRGLIRMSILDQK